jgi:hypothetical protein
MFTFDPASCRRQSANRRSPISTATRANCSIAAIRSNSSRHCDFLETCYLLKNGELPNKPQRDDFVASVKRHTMVHEQITRFYQGFRRDAHPMAVLVGVVGALSAFYHDSLDINDPRAAVIAAMRLIAKMPTIAAMAYKYTIGSRSCIRATTSTMPANFLHMMFACRARSTRPNPVLVARAGSHPDPACRPRAERLDLDRALWPARPAPTRSPASPPASPACGGRPTAAPTRPACGCWRRSVTVAHARIHQARQGQERSVQADGLRSPCLQELSTRAPS